MQYSGAFHQSVADMQNLRDALAACAVTNDRASFLAHLSDAAKYAYATQNDLDRLPNQNQTDRHFALYLRQVDNQVESWLRQDQGPTPAVHSQVQAMYNTSSSAVDEMNQISERVVSPGWTWTDGGQTASMASTGMSRMDEAMGAIVRQKQLAPTQTTVQQTKISRPTVAKTKAINVVAKAVNASNTQSWQASLQTKGQGAPFYTVTGRLGNDTLHAEVSAKDGRLLSLHWDRPTPTASRYDFAQAAQDAKAWLRRMGYTNVVRSNGYEIDHDARFTFQPVISGYTVYGSSIHVTVALDNGQVVGFYETGSLPPANWKMPKLNMTAGKLENKLSSSFHVQTTENVIWKDQNGSWVPAIIYDGSLQDEPYRVVLDARNGSELFVGRL